MTDEVSLGAGHPCNLICKQQGWPRSTSTDQEWLQNYANVHLWRVFRYFASRGSGVRVPSAPPNFPRRGFLPEKCGLIDEAIKT